MAQMTQISEQRRAQIVASARTIVEDGGPERLTAEVVAKAVGVSRPLLYHYFTNMDDLLGAVTDQYLAAFVAGLARWEEEVARSLREREPLHPAAWVPFVREHLVESPLRGSDKGSMPAVYQGYLSRCAEAVAQRLLDDEGPLSGVLRSDAREPLRETLHFAFLGFGGMLCAFPDVSDEDIVAVVRPLFERLTDVVAEEEDGARLDSGDLDSQQQEAQPQKKGFFNRFFGVRQHDAGDLQGGARGQDRQDPSQWGGMQP